MLGGPLLLVLVLTEELACPPIYKVQPGARGAGDPLIFVFPHIIVFVRPMLDVNRCRRTPENEMGHLSEYDGTATQDYDLAQGPRRTRLNHASRRASPALPGTPLSSWKVRKNIREKIFLKLFPDVAFVGFSRGLCRRDKTLGAPAFRAFIDVMHKPRLFLLDARKPHPPTAFEANGLLAERLRIGLRFHELLSAKASQGSMTGSFTPILSGSAAVFQACYRPSANAGGDPDREYHSSAKDQVRRFRSSSPSPVAVALFLTAQGILLARQLGGGAISILELHIRTQNQ
jgi:hypothetical protein